MAQREQAPPPTGTIYFDRLTGGMVPYADPLAVGPESYPHIFKDLKNLIPWRGRLQRREATDAPLSPALVPLDGPVADYPILIWGIHFDEDAERYVVVTTRHLWISDGNSTWFQITPTHPPGGVLTNTCHATNGSTLVTGVLGTHDWLTRCIGPGQRIKIGSGWYTIASVSTETTLLLTTPFTGVTNDYTYLIYRTFAGGIGGTNESAYAAAVVLNGDVYVTIRNGGVFWTGSPPAVTHSGETGIVLKISRGADDRKTSFGPEDVTIVMSTHTMEPATYPLFQLFDPKGLEVLEDGRLVLASHVQNYIPDYQASNRILFSSHLDVFNWASPGGFVDLIGARGGITAMKRMGGRLAVHFQDQVQLGVLSGNATQPITWQPTRATCGAGGPRLIIPVPATEELPGGQLFLANTGELHLFDGDQSPRVPSGWADFLRDQALGGGQTHAGIIQTGHFSYDEYRRSVSMFYLHSTHQAYELRFDLDTGVNSRHQYPALITAANEPRIMPFTRYLSTGTFNYAARIIGVRGTDSTGAATAYLYSMQLDTLTDQVLPQTSLTVDTGGFLAETHDLMLGVPDRESRVLRVILWYHGRDEVIQTIICKLSVDSGTTWETGVGDTEIDLTNTPDERRVTFYFSTSAPADRARIRLEGQYLDLFSFALSRMLIEFAPVADARAVGDT